MKKIASTLAAALLMLPLCASAQDGTKWTLSQCVDYALSNNIKIKKASITRQSAEEDVAQSKSSLLPSLDFSTNHSVSYTPWPETGQGVVSNGYVHSNVNKAYYNGSYTLSASWTVWDGNKKRNTLKLNRLTARQAELDSATTANTIQEQIAQLYVQILYTADAINVSKTSLETSTKNAQRGNEMLKVGKMSKADVAQLDAQVAQDKYAIVEAEGNLKKYKLQLKQLLEITDEQDFDVVIPSTTDEQALAEIPALNTVYAAALSSRPEIESSKLGIESGDLNIDIAKAGRMPQVGLSASVGTNTTTMSDNAWGKQLKTNLDGMLGVNITVPIFDNRQTKTAIRKAQLERESSLLDLKDKQKELYSTIEGYWIEAVTNQNKFVSAKASVESEQQSYDLLSEQFRLGLKNIVELMTGKSNLVTAQQNELQSKYMTILNQQLLKFYKGEGLSM